MFVRVTDHPGVIKLLDWYLDEEFATIVMDRPRNSMDLFDLIAERGKLDERQASKIFKQVSVIRLIFDRSFIVCDSFK